MTAKCLRFLILHPWFVQTNASTTISIVNKSSLNYKHHRSNVTVRWSWSHHFTFISSDIWRSSGFAAVTTTIGQSTTTTSCMAEPLRTTLPTTLAQIWTSNYVVTFSKVLNRQFFESNGLGRTFIVFVPTCVDETCLSIPRDDKWGWCIIVVGSFLTSQKFVILAEVRCQSDKNKEDHKRRSDTDCVIRECCRSCHVAVCLWWELFEFEHAL